MVSAVSSLRMFPSGELPLKPLCIDLFCGLGGWSEAFLAEGYECVGYDIEAHDYGSGGYPGTLVLRDIRSIHGSEFKDAAVIVASPPCQGYSYRAMPWSRAKALPPPDNALFEACFRIQREASEAAGHYIPLIVENVRGAQKWVGRARWHYGSFFLWGDVPALMPMTVSAVKHDGSGWRESGTLASCNRMVPDGNKTPQIPQHPREDFGWNHSKELQESRKVPGIDFNGYGKPGHKAVGFNVVAAQRYREGVKQPGISGVRANGKGDKWFAAGAASHGSRSSSRKAASAMIAKIPFPLAQHIARTYYPKPMAVVNG